MTFNEACDVMKKIAKNDAWSFQYEKASFINGCKIQGYIRRYGLAESAHTYEDAINNVLHMVEKNNELSGDNPPDENGN